MIQTKKSTYIVITQTECLNWITSGRILLCLNRILSTDTEDLDLPHFKILMDTAPYMGINDEAYIITELKPDYFITSSGIHIKHVKQFFPMTDRARNIVSEQYPWDLFRLGKAQYEYQWKEWAQEQRQNSASFRGERLLDHLNLTAVFERTQDNNMKIDFIIKDPRKKIQIPAETIDEFLETQGYGWYYGIKSWLQLSADQEKTKKDLGLKEILLKLREDQNLRKTFLNSKIMDEAHRIENHIARDKYPYVSLPHIAIIATVIHYWMMFENHVKKADHQFFIKDLVQIASQYGLVNAAITAYSIASKMPDDALTTFIYNQADFDITKLVLLSTDETVNSEGKPSQPTIPEGQSESKPNESIEVSGNSQQQNSQETSINNLSTDETVNSEGKPSQPTIPEGQSESKPNESIEVSGNSQQQNSQETSINNLSTDETVNSRVGSQLFDIENAETGKNTKKRKQTQNKKRI